MTVESFHKQIQKMFAGVDTAEADSWPPRGALSNELNSIVTRHSLKSKKESFSINVDQNIVNYFAKATIEMWHRSLHSFLISASLTEMSPIWASVSGYYSSHYTIRAFAHMLGYFQLFRNKKIVHLEYNTCYFDPKTGKDREHIFYWKKVKNHPFFYNNSFFTYNPETDDESTLSDAMHRNRANYWDLIDQFTSFQILDKQYLRKRINEISGVQLTVATIPSAKEFPNVYKVQLVAYNRLIMFRSFLDHVLDTNKFWLKHRKPDWCSSFISFPKQPENITAIREFLTQKLS